MYFAAAAKVANAAQNVRVDGDVISESEALHAVAHDFDHAGILVARNQRQIRGIEAVQNMRIGAADARSRNPQQKRVGANLGLRRVDQVELADLGYL